MQFPKPTYFYFLFYRPTHTEEVKLEFYKKVQHSTSIHGRMFEYQFCAIVYLRAKTQGQKFKLASNVKGLRPFDDVVVEYLDHNCRKCHIYVQLKSKTKHHITVHQLLADRGDFSLRRYYISHMQIEEKLTCSELGLKIDGSSDDSLFIIYTNADVQADLRSN
jgi:hypothetical protein